MTFKYKAASEILSKYKEIEIDTLEELIKFDEENGSHGLIIYPETKSIYIYDDYVE